MRQIKQKNKIPLPVWIILISTFFILLTYSLIFPPYRGPDEPLHFDIVRTLTLGEKYPAWDEAFSHNDVNNSLREVKFAKRSKNLALVEPKNRNERLSFDELGDRSTTAVVNQIASHPALYYLVMSLVDKTVRALPGALQWDAELSLLRIANVLLTTLVGLFGFLTAKTLKLNKYVAYGATLFPLLIPEFLHIASTVNNDNLLVLIYAVLTWLLAKAVMGDVSKLLATVIGLVTGLAFLVKGSGLFVPIWITVVFLLVLNKNNWRSLLQNLFIVGVISLSGAWWWFRNILEFHKLLPAPTLLTLQPDFIPDWSYWVPLFFNWMSRRFWGWFGWFDFELPRNVAMTASLLVILVTIFAISSAKKRKKLIWMAVPLVGLLVLSMYFAGSGYIKTGATPAIQGRYLFGSIVPTSVLFALGLFKVLGQKLRRWTPLVVLGSAIIINALAFKKIFAYYWSSSQLGIGKSFQAFLNWSPWPQALTITAISLTSLLVIITLVCLLREVLIKEPKNKPLDVDRRPSIK